MSSKWFCDGCGTEITRNYVSKRLQRKRGRFVAEVMVHTDGTSNKGDICLRCLMDVITKGKTCEKP